MVDFRNAIFHNKYNIENGQVIYINFDNQSVVLTGNDLNERVNEATAMFDVISDFALKKRKELEKS